MKPLTSSFAFALLLFTFVGCGDMSTSEREDRELAQGYTPCNDFPNPTRGVICHPDQYCGSQRFQTCYTGCLSEDNCTHQQVCVKNSGQRIGACVSRESYDARQASAQDLEPGYTACGQPATESRFSICHPSQYCSSSYFALCSLGCLSEHNCTELQSCVKEPGENIGACTSGNSSVGADGP